MEKILSGILLISLSITGFAKTKSPLCNGVTGSTFTVGSGTISSPYLICNTLQFTRLAQESALLTKSFVLGSDLSFQGMAFPMIGSQANPFQGTLDGDNYALRYVSINATSTQTPVGPFVYIKNSKIDNLIISTENISGGSNTMGGLAGVAETSTITNVQVKGLYVIAKNRSGGLVGSVLNSSIRNSSVQGTLSIATDINNIGGLIGIGSGADISSSSSNVIILERSISSSGVAIVGDIAGQITNSKIRNTYALGTINFSKVTLVPTIPPTAIGGLIGLINSSLVSKSFYAGKMINIMGPNIGGAAGLAASPVSDNVVWDTATSGQSTSAVGVGNVTSVMFQAPFWVTKGFDATIWKVVNGAYPKLIWQP